LKSFDRARIAWHDDALKSLFHRFIAAASLRARLRVRPANARILAKDFRIRI
jgi:hypothetical protein